MDAKFPPLLSIRSSSDGEINSLGLLVDEETHQTSTGNAGDHWNRKCCGRRPNTYSTNKDYSFKALAKDCDEWQDEHGVFFAPCLEAALEGSGLFGAIFGFEGLCELDTPLILKLRHSEQSRAHDRDDNGG